MAETKTFTMEALRQITNLTQLDDGRARKLLNKHNGNAEAAIDAYYNSQRDTYLGNNTNNEFDSNNWNNVELEKAKKESMKKQTEKANQYYINRYKKQKKLPLNKRPSSEHKKLICCFFEF